MVHVDKIRLGAVRAREQAYAPYSQFAVGAAVWTVEGGLFTGCNVENGSYSLSLCAERVAVFKAASEGHRKMVALAVVADTPQPVVPCGACLQVFAEWFSPHSVLHLGNTGGKWREVRLRQLLPEAFLFEGRDADE